MGCSSSALNENRSSVDGELGSKSPPSDLLVSMGTGLGMVGFQFLFLYFLCIDNILNANQQSKISQL